MNRHRGKILRLLPNRVWRTYSGGRLLDRMEARETPVDGEYPEDWIGSTVQATNPTSVPNEGLARVAISGEESLLADLIADDPGYFFDEAHLRRFGANPMVLVKYLDAAVRLPFQVHPTVEFSRRHLDAECGKTEAYYILDIRPEVTRPFIYLGFQRSPRRAELKRMIVEQDIACLESCFDRIPVHAGDVYVVPGGLPHAIGPGILMIEVMEPTDFAARVEFHVAGRTIPEAARFMGRDVDFALDMFSFQACSVPEIQSRWRCRPEIIASTTALTRESLVDRRLTDCFRIQRTTLTGEARWHAQGFTVLIVVEGNCRIRAGGEEVQLSQFDRIVVPCGLGPLEMAARDRAVFLECLPP